MRARRRWYLIISGAVVVVVVAVVVSVLLLSGKPGVAPIPGQETDTNRPVTAKVWPAPLTLHVPIDAATQADQPSDVELLDGNMYLVDYLHGRLLEISADGKTFTPLDGKVDPKLALTVPMGIAASQGQLYVADAGAGRVLVVEPSGKVSRVITLAKASPADASPPWPIGIAVWSDGSFVVSDAANNRLNKYDANGKLLWSVGSGAASSDNNGFNNPTGVALDKQGNVYVVDMYNSQVKKYTEGGQFVFSFGQLGDQAGQFSRAMTVAVDDFGDIYVSDALQAAVQVFDEGGNFIGFIGRKDLNDPKSGSLFQAPYGLKIIDGKLYVVDRYNGLFVFTLPTTQPVGTESAPTSTTTTQSAN